MSTQRPTQPQHGAFAAPGLPGQTFDSNSGISLLDGQCRPLTDEIVQANNLVVARAGENTLEVRRRNGDVVAELQTGLNLRTITEDMIRYSDFVIVNIIGITMNTYRGVLETPGDFRNRLIGLVNGIRCSNLYREMVRNNNESSESVPEEPGVESEELEEGNSANNRFNEIRNSGRRSDET